MKKIKRIVVGIDIFVKSNNVLKRALMIATQNKAELFIVHVVQIPWFSAPSYFTDKKIGIDKKGIIEKIEKKIKVLNKENKVPYSIFVKEGTTADALGNESKLFKADMIIIGANTKSKKKFLGTTAEKVAHQSHLPVLIVKNSVKERYQNIVAPTDFQVQSKQSIAFAKNIFPDTEVNLVHSFEVIYFEGPYTVVGRDLTQYNEVAKKSVKRDLKELMRDFSIKKGKVLDEQFDSKKALIKYIDKGSYDLVVVGSRGTAGFKALLGSMASSILRATPVDVLVYVP